MAGSITFYFDFASPFAYFSIAGLEDIAARHDRDIRWVPFLLWAARKHFGMTPPMEDGAKGPYLMADTVRSAAFHGVPFRMPDSFGRSTHLAARLFHGLGDPARQVPYAKAVFAAHFRDNRDISDAGTLLGIAEDAGIGRQEAEALASAQSSKDALAAAVEAAIAANVWGSPFFILDGEGFFGADRLPQLDWRLSAGLETGGGG